MKFRAKLLEVSCMKQFANIVVTLSKLSRTCILRICEDRLYFIVPDENRVPLHRMTVWSMLDRNEFFNTYNMHGDTESNEIYLEFLSDMLASSLSSLKAGSSVISMKIKLTNKSSPCLTLELELATQVNHTQLCVHDVPVTIIQNSEWSEFQEPDQINYDVSIEMPNMKIVRNVVDRMKKLSNKVTITAKDTGSFSLSVKTTTATIETHFKDLHVRNRSTGAEGTASVCVDVKKLAHFLTCETLNPTLTLCNIISGHVLHQYLENKGFKLNYYLTAVDE